VAQVSLLRPGFLSSEIGPAETPRSQKRDLEPPTLYSSALFLSL